MDLSTYDIDTRVSLHIHHFIETGVLHNDFENDALAFVEQDVTSNEQARICLSLCRIACHMDIASPEFPDVLVLVDGLLAKSEGYLLLNDSKAGRA